MSYNKFKPDIWDKVINRELERTLVFAEDCNRQYEGLVKEAGDTVRILGTGKPTITTTVDGESPVLGTPEKVTDTSISMPIKNQSFYNFMVPDIDKAQAVNGVLEALTKESAQGVANEMDIAIANLAADTLAVKDVNTAYQVTVDNVLGKIDAALEKLYENDVKPNDNIILTVSPRFYMILKQKYEALDTDNSEMLKNGVVAKYANITVKMSNNVATANSGATDLIMLRTQKAIAFANPVTHVEPYRPDTQFADAVKGFVLYGQKIVRPKELVVMNCKYAA